MDAPLRGEREQAWNEIEAARPEMRKALDDILARLREAYVTVNIRKTNLKAWHRYRDDTANERFDIKETQKNDIDKKNDGKKTGSKEKKRRKNKKQ
ncbi:hypothetical protein HJA86_27415 [Rhizobium bangladeshense]|nr:hypothetical protein [Rhizobium bangladeshense]